MSVWCAAESEQNAASPFGFAAVWRAYLACRRRKRGTANAQAYELGLLDRVVDTATALAARAYAPSRSLCFVARHPKARDIHAADFADRVVHHLLVPRLEAIYEPVFIHDLYSNRKGKGTHLAVERLSSFMRSLLGQGEGTAYALQLDVKNFFNTIDRRLLWEMLKPRIVSSLPPAEAGELSWLAWRILCRHPAENVVRRGAPRDFDRVPPHKRLANAPPGTGLPIGNLTSQFFANVYLNELDQFVKHQLKCRYYLRYVDDMVLLHHDPSLLLAWREAIAGFLRQRLRLELKDEGRLCPVEDGLDFLGYIVRPHYRLVRRRVVGNLRQRLDAFTGRFREEAADGEAVFLAASVWRDCLRAVLASYLGHFRHADAWRLAHSLWRRHPWLGLLFELRPGCRLRQVWRPESVTSLASQWRFFMRRFPGFRVLMQVGRRLEVYEDDAAALAGNVGRYGFRPERSLRPGFSRAAVAPWPGRERVCRALRRDGVRYVLVAEEGWLKSGMKRRSLLRVWPFPLAAPLPPFPSTPLRERFCTSRCLRGVGGGAVATHSTLSD